MSLEKRRLDGGCLYVHDGTVTIKESTFEGCRASYAGGAMYVYKTSTPMTIESTTFKNNEAFGVADILRKSNHSVIYTGAGVSTSTGISDYRGPNGVWTTLAEGRIPDEQFDLTSAQPSFTHMAITKLVEVGLVKFVTSTNLDGLHYKSGLVPLDNLAELHGSMFVERCCRCSKDVLRPFPIRRGGALAAELTTHFSMLLLNLPS